MNGRRTFVQLLVLFVSTFLELVGYFMMSPWLLLQLSQAGVSTALSGLFAATSWLGIFLITPVASRLTGWLGRRPALWLSTAVPAAAALAYLASDWLTLWFVMTLASGLAAGLRWVLAEALVAELSPDRWRGRIVSLFATLLGLTFVTGPSLLAWMGPEHPRAPWLALSLLVAGLLSSLAMPALPESSEAPTAAQPTHHLGAAMRAHPAVMWAGLTGGFFEAGMASILPLWGLSLGMNGSDSALLASASGLGSTLLMLPTGLLADRWKVPGRGRQVLMVVASAIILFGTLALPLTPTQPLLAHGVAFAWGAGGGALYTLAMIDIGSRERGLALVNNTSGLDMCYTLGGLMASSCSGVLLQWAPSVGFPSLLAAVALLGLIALQLHRQTERH